MVTQLAKHPGFTVEVTNKKLAHAPIPLLYDTCDCCLREDDQVNQTTSASLLYLSAACLTV